QQAPGEADRQPDAGGRGDGRDRGGHARLPAASGAGAAALPVDAGGAGAAQTRGAGERALRVPDQGVSARTPAGGFAAVPGNGAVHADRRDAPVGAGQLRPQRRQDRRLRRAASGPGVDPTTPGGRPEHGEPTAGRRTARHRVGATQAGGIARRGPQGTLIGPTERVHYLDTLSVLVIIRSAATTTRP